MADTAGGVCVVGGGVVERNASYGSKRLDCFAVTDTKTMQISGLKASIRDNMSFNTFGQFLF